MKYLVLYYSQTGQTEQAVKSFCEGLPAETYQLIKIQLDQEFTFPWKGFGFFNAFPETFLHQNRAFHLSDNIHIDYDCVLLAYQPWFLSPSPAICSFMQSDRAKSLLYKKDVITLITCRNMWLNAQEFIKKQLASIQANHLANLVLADNAGNLVSLITIIRWMFSGKRDAFFIFPRAGITQTQFDKLSNFRTQIETLINKGEKSDIQSEINKSGALVINKNLVILEQTGRKSFGFWAGFISNAKSSSQRKFRVRLYEFLLLTLIFLVSPISSIRAKIILLLKSKSLQAKVDYFSSNNYHENPW